MNRDNNNNSKGLGRMLNRIHLNLRPKLVLIFLLVKIIPLILLAIIAYNQIISLGHILQNIAVKDATKALNDGARESIERLTTDTALAISDFLRQRDQDILKLAWITPSDEAYMRFSNTSNSMVMKPGEWVLSDDLMSWVEKDPYNYDGSYEVSTNRENNDVLYDSSFRYRPSEHYLERHANISLYDEITFIDLEGNEIYKYVSSNTTKKNYPLSSTKSNVSNKGNTYVKAETYFEELKSLKAGRSMYPMLSEHM